MSSAPKRLHEEVGHPLPSKKQLEENSVLSSYPGKLIQPVGNEYRIPIEPNPDGRMTKIPRIDSRESDKRLPALPIYRTPSPVNGPCSGYSGQSENRPEPWDLKEGRDTKIDNREIKAEAREKQSEARVDPQNSKVECDTRQETRVDGKELRIERESHVDLKSEKSEKDGFYVATPFNWKETKETHKSIRYSESPEGLETWRSARHALHNSTGAGKEISATEGQESQETCEAVGENKIELKSEEKIREKERKRKEERHREWVEKDKDRHDRHNNLHLVNSSKDLSREDRDPERSDKEWKDYQKERDVRDRERDLAKKTLPNLNEREILRNERDQMEISSKMSELDIKKPKEMESWKVGERENKEKRRDREQDPENDRHEKRNKGLHDKETDDGYAEGDGTTEKDRDKFGCSVLQRKRMLRPRGSSQGSNREPRFRSRPRENEGSQEKSEMSSIVYKVGECMQEFLKSWKEYEASQNGKKEGNLQSGPILEIRIPAEHITSSNRQVKGGQLWGTDIYSDDSDLVAVLMHTGYCRPMQSAPPAQIQELRATVCVLPPRESYTSTLRNNVRSRAWGAGISCSFRVERCCIVKKGGGTIDLEPRLTHMSAMEPTLAPVSAERTMTTRSAALNALRQQRFIREVTIQYNLCNEPWLKYSINVVADKGLKKLQYTSARLKKGEVLYLETHSARFELCFSGEKLICNGTAALLSSASESTHEKSTHHSTHFYTGDRNHDHNNIKDVFRWSRCKKALPQKVMRSIGIPSPIENLEVLEENLDWEDLQWSQTGVLVAGKEYTLARVHFLSQS